MTLVRRGKIILVPRLVILRLIHVLLLPLPCLVLVMRNVTAQSGMTSQQCGNVDGCHDGDSNLSRSRLP